MYLSELDIIAITLAIGAMLIVASICFYNSYRYERAYRDTLRLLKQERSARAYWQEHKETSV